MLKVWHFGIHDTCFSLELVSSGVELLWPVRLHATHPDSIITLTLRNRSGAFSGLLAFGISFMSGRHGLLGWSWIFVCILSSCLFCKLKIGYMADYRGYRNSCCWHSRLLSYVFLCAQSLATYMLNISQSVLVDFPATASFLTPEERSYIIWRKKFDNSTVGEEEHFALKHVWKAFSDWQVWSQLAVSESDLNSVVFCRYGYISLSICQLLGHVCTSIFWSSVFVLKLVIYSV